MADQQWFNELETAEDAAVQQALAESEPAQQARNEDEVPTEKPLHLERLIL